MIYVVKGHTCVHAGEAAVTADARYTQQAMKLLTSYLAACTQLAITPAQPAQPGLPTPPNMSSETHMRDSANAQHGAVASHASSDSAAITSSMLEQRPGLGGSHCQRDPSCSACQPAAAVGGTIFSNTLGAEPHSSSAEPSGVVSVAANGDARVIPMEAARCGVHSSVTAQTTENANPHVASQITLAHLDFDMMQCAEMWTEACCHQIPEVCVIRQAVSSLSYDTKHAILAMLSVVTVFAWLIAARVQ